MGRARGRREKLRYEVLSVRQRCFESRLRLLVRRQFGVCEAEAVSVVCACLDYLRQARPAMREPFDLALDVPEGRALRWKVAAGRAPSRQVVLSPVAESDLDLCLEIGVRGMQTARAVRMVEQADRAGCTMPLGLLASLVHQSTRTLTVRLEPLWQRGLHLPVLGVAASCRGLSRLAEVLRGNLQGRAVAALRRALLLAPGDYGRLLQTAVRLVKGYVGGMQGSELAGLLGLSPLEIDSALDVLRVEERSPGGRERLKALLAAESEPICAPASPPASPVALRSQFEAHIIRHHAFSASRAELLAEAVEQAAVERQRSERAGGELVYWATASSESAGKALADCELVAVTLAYYLAEEDAMPRGTMGDLKVRKASRLASAAHRQGGVLCLPDLAFLLGMGVSSLQKALAKAGLTLPTRGNVVDIGRGVTHRTRIVSLYVQGYTEPQIVGRTHHTYESVASYISDFGRVMVLVDQGLAPLHIRKVARMSLALVNTYIALYRQLDVPENQWKLNLMRRAAVDEEKKLRSCR